MAIQLLKGIEVFGLSLWLSKIEFKLAHHIIIRRPIWTSIALLLV